TLSCTISLSTHPTLLSFPTRRSSDLAPHPYMQKMRTLDFCIVLEGEIVLVLDTREVTVKGGEFVIQRGSNHSWSNRSGKPAVVRSEEHTSELQSHLNLV